MGGLEIGLLLIGLLCFIVSFFLSEKLSSSDINEFEKMSKSDINVIVEKQLKDADEGIKRMIDDGMRDAMHDFDIKGDQILNKKLMSITDYSDSVIDSIQKSHKEIVFMYNMLLEKQETLTNITKDVQQLESNLRQMKANILEARADADIPIKEEIFEIGIDAEELTAESINAENILGTPIDEVLMEEIQSDNPTVSNDNATIINMYKEGFSEVEIAKRLGRGLGEIKVVLGLFNR